MPSLHAHTHRHRALDGPFTLLMGLHLTVGRGPVARLLADLAEVGSGDRVLDVGCGPGTALREAARREADALGVDPSASMRRLARILTPHTPVLDGTAEKLPLEDGTFTVAWAASSAHHWSDFDAATCELHRVLGPGGRLIILERLSHGGGWFSAHAFTEERAEELAGRVAAAGFSDVRIEVTNARRKRHVAILGTRL